jgi:hypothetical protein
VTFNNCTRMGLRDIAAFCENSDTMMLAGTHLTKNVVDWRTVVDRNSAFLPFLGALGRYWIAEHSL